MKRRMPIVGLLALLAAAGAAPARADVTLPHILGSHMVLQRDTQVPVWGWAEAGEKVTVQIGDKAPVAATANDKGEWKVTLPAMPAGGPLTLKVAGKNTITLEDVLVGEVWLCSGQSNMEMVVASCNDFEKEKAAADYPQIRHVKVPRVPKSLPEKDFDGQWQLCTPDTVGSFTACGYFMARELQKNLKVPIGLVNSSWGGTRIEPWTPPVGFEGLPALDAIRRQVLLADPRTPEHKAALTGYLGQVEGWVKTARDAIAQETLLQAVPAYPNEILPMTSQGQPTTLYNGMIYPLLPFPIAGAIWYQGEANHGEGMLYTEKQKALVAGWRKLWGKELPFYFVQIAPYHYGTENPYTLAEFWEAQAAAAKVVSNSGMVVTHDIGNYADIHPKNKQEVGRRLALLALAGTYGQKGLVCAGPSYKEMSIEGDKIRVRFDNVGGGLVARDGKPLDGFEIIGEENDFFVKAQATVDGDSVLVSAPEVKQPTAARFAWSKDAAPNLMNKEGLPAAAFRAGKVPVRDLMAMNVPEARDYHLVYALDLAKAGKQIAYDEDRRAQVAKPFDRVAYFLELQKKDEKTQWVYVSMDAFTADLGKIGVPTLASKTVWQTKVNNLTVFSNVEGIVTGTGLKGGCIEFWPHNYGGQNAAAVPNASAQLFDFGDQRSDPEDGYGCMQVGNFEAKQTIFAFNNWKSGAGADVGIGNSNLKAETRDWTFSGNAGTYQVKKLRVLVHTK